ncbi:MAG: phosphodiester glycosidase family protein [Oscillospiraceae bacterium]|nr:phosphodiester glycosidase family protein [Oscillospiraceae bacterium]
MAVEQKEKKVSKLPAAARISVSKRIGQILAFVGVFILMIALTLFIMLKVICAYGASKNTFVTTVLESGQLKFLASLVLSENEIQEIVDGTKLGDVGDANINEGMISLPQQSLSGETPEGVDMSSIEIIEIAGLTYKATLMIIQDPSRVSVTSVATGLDEWPEEGVPLKNLVERAGAIGGVNGGLYESTNNSGGKAYGILVSNGEIIRNRPQEWSGLVLVGLTNNNILQIIDVSKMSAAESEQMIKEKGIRDAVCFQEATSSDNNHFVQLVINGVPREVKGAGSGLNPRTAVGQRADGAIMLLVTDGRGSSGHVGASAADLIEIMTRYGAVNAANIDGGSSTCMYYNGEYLQNSVTFYYSQSSWKLPCGFVVK